MRVPPQDDVIVGTTPLENELAGLHPRLYATQERFDQVKANLQRDPWATMLQKLRGAADHALLQGCPTPKDGEGKDLRGWVGGGLATLALAWRLTGDRKYFGGAVQYMKTAALYEDWGTSLVFGHWAHGMAVAYDWLYHDLDEATRSAISAHLRRQGQRMFDAWGSYKLATGIYYTFNHMAVPLGGLASAAGALYGEEPEIAPWLRRVLDKARLITTALGPDGASQEGINYGGYFLSFLLKTLDLVDSLLGVDLITPCQFLRNVPRFYAYSSLPRKAWSDRQLLFHFGDAFPSDWAPSPDRIIARRFRDGLAQWFADETEKQAGSAKSGSSLNLFWYDPSVKPEPPRALPTMRHFTDQDIVFMRSDWSGEESVFAFKCGPHSGHKALQHYHHEIGGGHMHPDAGTFLLFACGDWLIGDDGYSAKFTRQQNTVVVNGVGQNGEGGDWFEGVYIRREKRWPHIVRVDAGKDCDYVIGNAAPAYPLTVGLRRFLRHVLFIKPDCWVILDELETEQPATFELFFHAYHPFRAESGNQFVLRAPNGSLLLTPLLPKQVTGNAFKQTISMGTIRPDSREMDALVLTNSDKTAKGLFITALHAFPTSGRPAAALSLEEEAGEPCLAVKRDGQIRRFQLHLNRASIDQPILSRMTPS